MNERELIDAAQKEIATMKRSAEKMGKRLKQVEDINRKAGRLEAANAAMRVRGEVKKIHADLIVVHADATDAMSKYYPEFSDEVQTRGGGR